MPVSTFQEPIYRRVFYNSLSRQKSVANDASVAHLVF